MKEGHRHPMYIALDEIKEIFIGMGFTVLDGPEVELAELNFDRSTPVRGTPAATGRTPSILTRTAG